MGLLRRDSCRGSVMIEVLLGLPIFLVFILLFLWLAITMNSQQSLIASVTNGVAAGATRGDSQLMGMAPGTGTGIIPGIESYVAGGDFSGVSQLLSRHGRSDPEATYNEWLARQGYSGTLRDVPKEALYALVYVYESMKMGVGIGLRYPCQTEVGADPMDGSGCLQCDFMSLNDLLLEPCIGDPGCGLIDSVTLMPRERIGIECVYHVSNSFFEMISRLLGSATPGLRLRFGDRRFLEVSEFQP